MQDQPTFPSGNLPDLWGEGALFAFSGLDGPTHSASGFAATLGAEHYSLLWHTPARRWLRFRLPTIDNPLLVSSDLLLIETQAEELFVSFSAWHTLVGLAPAHTGIQLTLEDDTPAERRDDALVSIDPQGRDALALLINGPVFALAYGRTADEAIARARVGLAADLNQVAQDRLKIFGDLPSHPDEALDRLLKKCLAVMKVNTLSAEGAFRQAWSTPGRVTPGALRPEESVYHALAMNRLYPGIAWQLLKSALDSQNPDGMVPSQASPAGRKGPLTCPPLLAWGVWENYQRLRDPALLEYAFARLEDALDWDTTHRDRNRNGLLEWQIDDDPARRCPESGMDDSPRFDEGVLLDAIDFSVLAAREMLCIARIAGELGNADDARYWLDKSTYTSLKVHERLWDEGEGFYFDAHMDGTPSRVMSAVGFLPLLLDDIPAERIGLLAARMGEGQAFHTGFPIPCISPATPGGAGEGWRGGTWVHLNWLAILGLRKHGRVREAAWLRAATLDQALRHYERSGTLFDHYAASGDPPPPSARRDAHQTAAVLACLLIEDLRPG